MHAAADAAPITAAEADRLLAPLAGARGIVIAVSGGADSLALLSVVNGWRLRHRFAGPVMVATVDHGLRPTAASEAFNVALIAAAHGLPHRTLPWYGPKPLGGIEAAAREARYRMLFELAKEVGASHVLTAHHLDDQAETVLMRLGRGSGLSGLAAMAVERALGDGVVLARPFLGIAKARLAAVTRGTGLLAVADESNADPRFARARLRTALSVLEREGVDAAGLARTASLLRRADNALEEYVDRFLRAASTVDPLAVVRVDRAALAAEPEETRLRILARVVFRMGGAEWPPQGDQLGRLSALAINARPFRRTIRGVVVAGRAMTVEFHREAGRQPLPTVAVAPGYAGLWDNRFRIAVADVPIEDLTIGPLGEEGRRAAGLTGSGRAAHMRVLPAFRLGGEVVAVPPLGVRLGPGRELRLEAECVLARSLGIAPARSPSFSPLNP